MTSLSRALRAGTMLAAIAVTLGAARADTTLTVWDWKSGDPTTQPYYEAVKKDFEAVHPGVTVKYVMQPHDQYYTLLGTAISAGQGPDVVDDGLDLGVDGGGDAHASSWVMFASVTVAAS